MKKIETGGQQEDYLILRPSSRWIPINFRNLWEYRDLLFFLSKRDIQVRYKQTILGVGWAILQPLLTMVLFSTVFGKFGKIPSDGIPYPLFSFCGLVPWSFFANGLSQASMSLVSNTNLLKKVYFPRLIIPFSSIGSGFVDLAISSAVLFGFVFWYDRSLTFGLLFLPLTFLLMLGTLLGVSLWLSALNVWYRDIRYIIPFMIQLWLFATPIAYPLSIVPKRWSMLLGLNPMTTVVESFRWSFTGSGSPPLLMVILSVSVMAIVLLSGLYYFRSVERSFADVI